MVGGMESAAAADKRSREKGEVPVKKLGMLQARFLRLLRAAA